MIICFWWASYLCHLVTRVSVKMRLQVRRSGFINIPISMNLSINQLKFIRPARFYSLLVNNQGHWLLPHWSGSMLHAWLCGLLFFLFCQRLPLLRHIQSYQMPLATSLKPAALQQEWPLRVVTEWFPPYTDKTNYISCLTKRWVSFHTGTARMSWRKHE